MDIETNILFINQGHLKSIAIQKLHITLVNMYKFTGRICITTEFIILHLMFNNSYVCLDCIIFQAMSAIASNFLKILTGIAIVARANILKERFLQNAIILFSPWKAAVLISIEN